MNYVNRLSLVACMAAVLGCGSEKAIPSAPVTVPIPPAAELVAPEGITNTIGMELVLIKAGTFMMGSEGDEAYDDEKPRHSVRISRDFYLGVTEVTQGQWKAVMQTEPWSGKLFVKEGDNYPATFVSWDDAMEFCTRLSEKEGVAYRLPTEAEWEYACRAGSTTKYSFGDDESELGKYAWFYVNAIDAGEQYAHEVGKKLPNAWGLHDMHGNVWEWCQDWYDPYSAAAVVDPRGPSEGSRRVYHGGGWLNDAGDCRSSDRYGYVPSARGNGLGFRLAQGPPAGE